MKGRRYVRFFRVMWASRCQHSGSQIAECGSPVLGRVVLPTEVLCIRSCWGSDEMQDDRVLSVHREYIYSLNGWSSHGLADRGNRDGITFPVAPLLPVRRSLLCMMSRTHRESNAVSVHVMKTVFATEGVCLGLQRSRCGFCPYRYLQSGTGRPP